MKYCPQCKLTKPKEEFGKNKARHDGLNSYCRECFREKAKEIYRNGGEKTLKQKRVANKKKYYKNPELYREKRRDYTATNPEKISAYNSKYYQANKEYNNKRVAKYYKSHPEKARIKNNRREARKRGLMHDLTEQEWKRILKAFDNSCAYCDRETELQQDHVISVKNGGGYTRDNIVPACKSCNSSKQEKTIEEWKPGLDGLIRKNVIKMFLGGIDWSELDGKKA